MLDLRHGFGLLCLGAALVGQRAPAWTADEAMMASVLPALARGEGAPVVKAAGSGKVAGYQWRRMQPPPSAGHGSITYAWPANGNGRTFAITDRGVLMFTDQREQLYGQGDRVPAWDALVAKGSEAVFAQMLDMPGRGSDEQIWQPIATARHLHTDVAVQDADGQPIGNVTVVIAPESWFVRAPHVALPEGAFAVGLAATDATGTARVRGLGAQGVVAGIAFGSQPLDVACQLQTGARGLVLVADRIAIERLAAAQRNGNESAAIATLKNLASAQAQMQACGVADANQNGAGEYAFLAQLAGAAEVLHPAAPGGEVKVSPPVLSTAFANVHGSCAVRSGYLFQIYLPGKDGWLAEAPCGGGRGVAVDATRAEVLWCAYAWPLVAGQTGTRTFYIDQNGDVIATRHADDGYSGREGRPAPDAAQTGDATAPKTATNKTGNDGHAWSVIG